MATPDYFAELYVAGRFAEAGWDVYFPHRDKGFDFIVSKQVSDVQLIRPVQVKGKFPTETKLDRANYGYVGQLMQFHPEMVLAIPFFGHAANAMPVCTAYMPRGLILRIYEAIGANPQNLGATPLRLDTTFPSSLARTA